MKKVRKNLARKILCGLLAAGVVGVSGSALAADYSAAIGGGTYSDETFNLNVNNVGYPIDACDNKPITITSKYINITSTGDEDKQLVGADSWSTKQSDGSYPGAKLTLGGSATETIKITVKNTSETVKKHTLGLVSNSPNSDVEVTAKEFSLSVTGNNALAINVANNTQSSIAPANAAKMSINADKIDITSSGTAIGVFSNGQFTMNGDLTVNALNDNALEVRGNSTSNINADGKHTTVINGNIGFGTPNVEGGDGHNSGNIIDATLNINFTGEGSALNGKAYQGLGDKESIEIDTNRPYYGDAKGLNLTFADGAAWNMTGDSFVNNATVKDGASINVGENVKKANIENIDLNNAALNLQGKEQEVKILKDLKGTNGTVNTDSLDNKVTVENNQADNLTVNGTKEVTDAIASGKASLQKLADVVKAGDKSAADTVTSDANDIIGGYSAKVDGEGNVKTVKIIENTTNRAISDMANISLMTWRAENNDMNKRLGELRDSKGEHGAWARMARGESKYGAQNVKNQYNYYQVGYDEKLSVDPNWTVGVALTRTEGNSTFATGSGENKHTGVAVYGSYLNDNGSFIDLIAKYARMDNEYKTIGAGVGDADYKANGYSLSAEYGKRFTKDNGFWIEPQVELTYGTVGSVDYLTSKGYNVHQDSVDSLVGRLGFSFGKNIKQGNVYVRASYLYDFDGETKATMSGTGTGTAPFEQDLGGGWWEVGVGTNLNLSEATHLYFDVEKTYGGNVATPWQWNAGVRWSF